MSLLLWDIQEGDTIAFVDSSDPRPRRIADVKHPDPWTTVVELESPEDEAGDPPEAA